MVQTTFLYYLMKVAHYQSLSIAAEELHVSQPALSTGIKKLEAQLGVQLLERTYKGVTLTQEGKEVVELAEKAFVYLDEIETKYLQPKPTDNAIDDLMIYCNPPFSPIVMSALSAGAQSDNHLIQLYDLTPELNVKQLLQTNSNIVVLGIVSDTHKLTEEIRTIKLSSSQAYIMCSPEFPYIAPDKTSISFKELAHVPLSILNNPFEFQKILLNEIRKYEEPCIKTYSPNANTVTASVYTGAAASFSIKFFRSPANAAMRYIPIRNAPKFHLSLTFSSKANPDKVQHLAERLKQQLL